VRSRGEEGASGEPGAVGEEEKLGDVAANDGDDGEEDDDQDEMLAEVGDDTVAIEGSHHEAIFS
jgi:hypothetical protein